MFPTLEGVLEEIQVQVVDKDIAAMMESSGHGNVVLEEDVGVNEIGDSFKSFHHQASQPISRRALLAGFISIWLKKCVVPSLLHDGILPTCSSLSSNWSTDELLDYSQPWYVAFNMGSGR